MRHYQQHAAGLPTIEMHRIVLPFEGAIIRGKLHDYGHKLVVEVDTHPADVAQGIAYAALRSALVDGRIRLPDDVRSRIDLGKAVIR